MSHHRVHVEITPEEEGGYSVVCLDLPGCVSQGETVEEAVANITEAFQGAIECYRSHGDPIPWEDGVWSEQTPIRKSLVIETPGPLTGNSPTG